MFKENIKEYIIYINIKLCFRLGSEYVKLLLVFCHIVTVDNDPWIESKHVRIEVISKLQFWPSIAL